MRNFLSNCRQCYALIGLAIIVAAVLTVWSAGWAANELAHVTGLFPYEWQDCGLGIRGGCRMESWDGPQSKFTMMLFGLLVSAVCAGLYQLAKAAFKVLEELGQDAVKHIKEIRG